MIDNYELAENKGRTKLLNDFKSSPYMIEYNFTEDKYDNIDCYATAHTPIELSLYAIEIKLREIPMVLYADDGFIMEKIKYDALMEAHDNSGYCPFYICYFNDGRIVWDITKIQNAEERWILKPCTKTTASDYKKEVVLKKVILLFPNEGKIRKSQ